MAWLLLNPRAASDTREATFSVAAVALILALQSDELAREKPHRTTQLKTAAKRIGMSLDITRPDGTALAPR
ncbi:hypothetical protein GCM10022240_30060 [Microbacterium kribbense]|uniref:Uncharacterized protein n=1 Tax=Microbacterium kribbense TaxID=433645 RepID=A0ABP7GX43_9MICO